MSATRGHVATRSLICTKSAGKLTQEDLTVHLPRGRPQRTVSTVFTSRISTSKVGTLGCFSEMRFSTVRLRRSWRVGASRGYDGRPRMR